MTVEVGTEGGMGVLDEAAIGGFTEEKRKKIMLLLQSTVRLLKIRTVVRVAGLLRIS
jgi:hypothetical protein